MAEYTKQIKIGAILAYVFIGLQLISGLVFTPFLLKSLGQEEYGLYSLIGAFVAYLSIMDFGIGSTITRYVAKYRAEEDEESQNGFLATCIVLYLVIGFLVTLVGIFIYINIETIFSNSVKESQLPLAKTMLQILLCNIIISLVGYAYPAIITAYEKHIFNKITDIGRLVLRVGVLVLLLSLGFKSLAIVIVDTCLNILILFIKIIYVQLVLKTRIKLKLFSISIVKDIFSFSIFVFLANLINQVNLKLNLLVLGIVSDVVQISICSVAMMLVTYFTQFSQAVSGMFLPALTRLTASNTSMWSVENYAIRISRIQIKLLTLILVSFATLGSQFVILWVGREYSRAYNVALLMMIAYYMPFTQTSLNALCLALNRHKVRNSIYGICSIATLLLMIPLSKKYGATGSAIATLISMGVGYGIFIQGYYHKKIGINMFRFIKESYLDTFIPAVISFLVGVALTKIFIVSWGMFCLQAFVVFFTYIIPLWFIGMNKFERDLIMEPIRKVLYVKHKTRGIG
ncbi:lipopolysaccharide biosynthesis protein [Phosphitispora fastidiosa]|uniref:lipopolysaccharide biosynthesis protein n=1 Tax=Phosphitispora fastidiosa TaxID=2837202 RepID=UPI001E47640E|nr:oligosaccharide flippase family protein [Phosphitispora fastidiosa]MBU7007225.1 O-antigen/teichoic acid export membrane protein [Phosphitispora fastidiosa]